MLVEFQTGGSDRQVVLSLKPGAVSVSLDEVEVYSFDGEGRLLTAWVNEQTYVRTLDNRVIKKWRDPGRRRPWKLIEALSAEDKQRFLNQVWARINDLSGDRLQSVSPQDDASAKQARAWLSKIAAWDGERLEQERERFNSVYTPVSILPPDQYFALVLQATEGCHWNRCTFCHFYRHCRFRIKSDEEFGQHIQAVIAFFGDAIGLRRSIFLGDANALVMPQDKLLRILDRVNQAFAITPKSGSDGRRSFQGIYSFIDAFSGERKSEADFRALQARHLQRVYVGVETGCDELLTFLNKPATAQQALETVATMKRAGLQVGVIVLIGVGGDYYHQSHVEQTIRLLNAMNLGHGDIIYFSPLYEEPTSAYAHRAAEARIRSLTDRERHEQLTAIRSGLRFSSDSPPKVSLYDIREFVY
jgi:radical SAM superfamily enzyme YgiQ (UPF0313 family)